MRQLSETMKKDVVGEVTDRMGRWLLSQPQHARGPLGSYCVWWAFETVRVLHTLDIPAQIQAGTAYWPRLRQDQDDGLASTMTQFGYLFDPGVQNVATVAVLHRLPEMHAWVGIPAAEGFPSTLIDLTVRWWPDRCLETTGMDWPGGPPPPFLWADRLPKGVSYIPHLEAIRLCYQILYLTGWISGSGA